MRYRSYSPLRLRVSEIAFGTGDNAGGLVYGSAQEQLRLIEEALRLGINLFDTSPAYGAGRAEANLGRLLREVGAPDTLIATKVKVMPAQFDRIASHTEQSIDLSLERLGRECIDFLLVHNPSQASRIPGDAFHVPLTPRDILEEMLPSLVRARAAGKVRCLGLACDHVQLPALRQVLETREFGVINVVYHLLNPSAVREVKDVPIAEDYSGLFDLAQANNTSVAVISPLAGGALTSDVLQSGQQGLHPLSRGWFRHQLSTDPSGLDRALPFAFLNRPGEQSLVQAAYRFILGEPRVSTVIGGFSSPAQMQEAAAASMMGPLEPQDRAEVDARHSPRPR